jgi:acetyltransferase-like isoleucine patch superfamily enzyme
MGENIVITYGRYSHVGKDPVYYFNPTIHIGHFAAIADNVTFCGAMNYPCILDKKIVNNFPFGTEFDGDYTGGNSRGDINIGNDIWIGYKTKILDGVTIGDGARVGAFSVVAKDVPPYAVVVGNPAEIKYFRYTPEQIEKLLKIKWWDWSREQIKERVQDFKNIDIFLQKYDN